MQSIVVFPRCSSGSTKRIGVCEYEGGKNVTEYRNIEKTWFQSTELISKIPIQTSQNWHLHKPVGPRRRSGWTTSISSRTLEPPWGGVHIMSNLTIISWSHADEPAFFLNAWRIWPWHWSWLSWRSSFRPTISVIPWRNRPRLWPGSPWRVVIIIMILLMIPVPVSSFHCLEKTTV